MEVLSFEPSKPDVMIVYRLLVHIKKAFFYLTQLYWSVQYQFFSIRTFSPFILNLPAQYSIIFSVCVSNYAIDIVPPNNDSSRFYCPQGITLLYFNRIRYLLSSALLFFFVCIYICNSLLLPDYFHSRIT